MQISHSSFQTHNWLKPIHICFVPGANPGNQIVQVFINNLLCAFQEQGHHLDESPGSNTTAILTTATFGVPVNWRNALMFTARKKYKLSHAPTVFTIVHLTGSEFQMVLKDLESRLQKNPVGPENYNFPGLAQTAYKALHEQGLRGGPLLSFARLVQAQTLSIRLIILVGDHTPEYVHLIDLVGAHPLVKLDGSSLPYHELALRITTVLSTREVTHHQVLLPDIEKALWDNLPTPREMCSAAREFGKRQFFTDTVKIADLIKVPALNDAIASQYSEGCFATWEPRIPGLIATVTGSARPVDKGSITTDDLAVIHAVRPDGLGAIIRNIAGRENTSPSSEAVELIGLDQALPKIPYTDPQTGETWQVPVARSKLHGHRGVTAYHPDYVEFVPLDLPYSDFPVSCATEAQAIGIIGAFSRSAALNNPLDSRQVAFTILPGHGIVIIEKWDPSKAPFQLIWEYMDASYLVISRLIPQGRHSFTPGPDGMMQLSEK